MDIATTAMESSLHLHISVYVTCLCDPEAVPTIPNMDVIVDRPHVTAILKDFILSSSASPRLSTTSDVESCDEKIVEPMEDLMSSSGGNSGGIAVCASGPCSLTRETQHAVAKMSATEVGVKAGGIALHTEMFVL
jgi:ferric-chelate reductase